MTALPFASTVHHRVSSPKTDKVTKIAPIICGRKNFFNIRISFINLNFITYNKLILHTSLLLVYLSNTSHLASKNSFIVLCSLLSISIE